MGVYKSRRSSARAQAALTELMLFRQQAKPGTIDDAADAAIAYEVAAASLAGRRGELPRRDRAALHSRVERLVDGRLDMMPTMIQAAGVELA